MNTPQVDYEDRLPYGYWYGPVQGKEYLFDRGYNAIAARSRATPWVVETYAERRFIDAGQGRVQAYYYNSDSTPRRNPETLDLCERILARFISGRDVRFWLSINSGLKQPNRAMLPKTGFRYLTRQPSRKMALEMGLESSPRVCLVDDLLS